MTLDEHEGRYWHAHKNTTLAGMRVVEERLARSAATHDPDVLAARRAVAALIQQLEIE